MLFRLLRLRDRLLFMTERCVLCHDSSCAVHGGAAISSLDSCQGLELLVSIAVPDIQFFARVPRPVSAPRDLHHHFVIAGFVEEYLIYPVRYTGFLVCQDDRMIAMGAVDHPSPSCGTAGVKTIGGRRPRIWLNKDTISAQCSQHDPVGCPGGNSDLMTTLHGSPSSCTPRHTPHHAIAINLPLLASASARTD